MTSQMDVLVVGAGPVGLFCANELARHQLTYRIIDKKHGISTHSKALGLHIRTLDALEDCGFLEAIDSEGQRVKGAQFHVKGRVLMDIEFKNIGSNRDYLIDLPQNKTEAIFEQALKKAPHAVEWASELIQIEQTATGVKATIKQASGEEETVHAKWIIGCDGAHSRLRHLLHEGFDGASYAQKWWLADVHMQWEYPQTHMHIFISDKGPLACFPMGGHRYRLVLTAPEQSVGDPKLTDIQAAFIERSHVKATLQDPLWLSEFNIHHRQVRHYRHGRVFLAGDAAHIHSPMGGQGLNTGIQDIYNLVWKLALFEKGQADERLLDSYHLERYPVGRDVLKKTHVMTKMIQLKHPFLVSLRNAAMSFLLKSKRVQHHLARDLAELTIDYSKSPVIDAAHVTCDVKPGQFVGDFVIWDKHAKRDVASLERLKGTHHHILIFEEKALDAKAHEALCVWSEALQKQLKGVCHVTLIAADHALSLEDDEVRWVDKNNAVKSRLGINKTTVVLVRPDKYVGAVLTKVDTAQVLKALSTMGVVCA